MSKRGKGEHCCFKQSVRPLVKHIGAGCWPEDGGEEDGQNERRKTTADLVVWLCAAQ